MNDTPQDKFVKAYNTMLSRVKETLHAAEDKALPPIKDVLDKAAETASELGEVSREEAEKIGEYLRRDIRDAAEHLSETGKGIKEWLKFDLEFAEVKLAELLASVADSTRVELEALAEQARKVGEWHTGEVTGIGILRCVKCGETLKFEKTGHIPPCPKCRGTVFKKHYAQSED